MMRQYGNSSLYAMEPVEMCEEPEICEGVDDVTGKNLDPEAIRVARAEEMEGFREHGVYHHVPRHLAETYPGATL